MRASDEATKEQLQMAKEQGDALGKALHHMVSQEADDGAEKAAGDYVVGYAVEKAEGMYQLVNGELVWQEPGDKNVHLEVSVRDGADGRFIPNLNVQARLIDSSGNDVGLHRQPYTWHPWLYHYGRNWKVPGDGTYGLNVRVEAPDFPRHDKKNGRRFVEDVEVEFSDVKIKTGQK
jgi:hypothetical protein